MASDPERRTSPRGGAPSRSGAGHRDLPAGGRTGLGRRSCRAISVLVVVLAGCTVGPGVRGTVDLAPANRPAVELTYLGVGGWIMEWRGTTLLAAPLFTNPGLVRTGLLPIRSDTAAVDRWMEPWDVSDAVAILVGHGHYDHLMDVPRVARVHAPGAAILGSRTVRNLLGGWSGVGERVVVVDSLAGNVERPGRWIDLGDALRVMPLESHHAPHFEGYTLYSGTADVPRTEEPASADAWVDGPTFAFLVDFLNADGSVALRLFYQDAVSAAPLGFAPQVLMEERPVDVAILVPATFDQVDWYPEALVDNLRPRWVLLGHWEDFFQPPGAETRSIRYSDMGHFESRLDRVLAGAFWRPELFTVFRLPVDPE